MTREEKLELACNMVLAFHSGDWTWVKQNAWVNAMVTLCPSQQHPDEATTKNLCDAVREALKP